MPMPAEIRLLTVIAALFTVLEFGDTRPTIVYPTYGKPVSGIEGRRD